MSLSSVKSAVVSLLDSLPDNCTWDDVAYAVYVRRKIVAGLNDVERGDVIDQETVFEEYRLHEGSVDQTGAK